MKKLSDEQRLIIKKKYEEDFTPMIELAQFYGVSRMAIHKVLTKLGVNTKKGEGGACRIFFNCDQCGKEAWMNRARAKKLIRTFCSQECYIAWVKTHGAQYVEWRQGSREARKLVNEFFPLRSGYIVHHKDGNQRNNELKNLMVFANSSDHMRHHRGGESRPIWEGSKCRQPKCKVEVPEYPVVKSEKRV